MEMLEISGAWENFGKKTYKIFKKVYEKMFFKKLFLKGKIKGVKHHIFTQISDSRRVWKLKFG